MHCGKAHSIHHNYHYFRPNGINAANGPIYSSLHRCFAAHTYIGIHSHTRLFTERQLLLYVDTEHLTFRAYLWLLYCVRPQ